MYTIRAFEEFLKDNALVIEIILNMMIVTQKCKKKNSKWPRRDFVLDQSVNV